MMVKRISFSGVSWSRTLMEELVMTTPEFSSTWMLLTDTTGLKSSMLCRTEGEKKERNVTTPPHHCTFKGIWRYLQMYIWQDRATANCCYYTVCWRLVPFHGVHFSVSLRQNYSETFHWCITEKPLICHRHKNETMSSELNSLQSVQEHKELPFSNCCTAARAMAQTGYCWFTWFKSFK